MLPLPRVHEPPPEGDCFRRKQKVDCRGSLQRPRPTQRRRVYLSGNGFPHPVRPNKVENDVLKRNQMSMDFEFDKLKSAHTELTQQHRIDAERLLLFGQLQSEFTGRGLAPRPSVALMRQHVMNRVEGSCPYNMADQVLRELENEVNESQHDAGQPSSIAPLPITNRDNVDQNSNDVNPTEVSIIPPPLHLLTKSFYL